MALEASILVPFLYQNSKVFIRFIFSVVFSGDFAFYFIEMILFVSFEGTLTQSRIEVRWVNFPE